MATLLVLTTGQTDVQLVRDGARYDLDKKDCGILHDELRERTGEWQVVDAPREKGIGYMTSLPQGQFLVCTPKLDAVLRYLETHQMPTAALVLETRRDLAGDPRYAGAVVAARLRNKGVQSVVEHVYLEGKERLENPNIPEDAVIRRTIVRGISESLAGRLRETKPSRIVVAATGGFPSVNSLLEEVVRLHAIGQSEVVSIEVPEGAHSQIEDRASDLRFQPAASYQARWHALSLIEKGHLLGAWGAVQHLHEVSSERYWIRISEWLSRFASSLPIPMECDLPVLSHDCMAARSALRVELSLRARDIPRAVHGTVAFCEAALLDHVLKYFTRKPTDARLFKLKEGAPPPTGKLLRDDTDTKDNKSRPFELKEISDGINWYRFFEDGAGRFARDYTKSERLKHLVDAVGKIKELRNDVAHNEPTPALMEEATKRLQDASLWSNEPLFLSQPIVRNVLVELGVREPETLCSTLLKEVRRRLVTVPG